MTALAASLLGAAPDGHQWPKAAAAKLPRWRGFNLLEKFTLGRGNRRFEEKDFRLIAHFGFNFVRLPMDYRLWIVDKDWDRFNEDVLKEIDEAVDLGEKYGVHVSINFHRGPGYCVNGARDPEPLSLWKDADAQRAFANHWRVFAKRYKGIPNERLSFNLLNEPGRIEPEHYLRVITPAVEAIRAEDPDRLIISDTIFNVDEHKLAAGLRKLGVAFSPHQYWPSEITHFRASWVDRASTFPDPPVWPMPVIPAGRLYAPTKPGVPHGPLKITGPFAEPTKLRLHLHRVSGKATLAVKADGKGVWNKEFVCGPGKGEWTKVIHAKKWDLYQNIFDKDYTIDIPAGTREILVEVIGGDWLILTELGVTEQGKAEIKQTLNSPWGQLPATLSFVPGRPFVTTEQHDAEELWDKRIGVWQNLQDGGVGTMIGEFGVFKETPHDVALAWLEDNLKQLKKADLGWALWNFRGGFGIFDSGRKDVQYEEHEGHQLDRKMLELLQRY